MNNIYETTAYSIMNNLETLIEDKKNTTTALAIAISKDYKIIDSLQKNQYDSVELSKLSNDLRTHTKYKNVWIEIFNKNGNRDYNSWGDESSLNEKVVRQLEEKIDINEYGLSFLASLPILKSDEYLGFLKLSTKVNSIANELVKENVNVVVLVNEEKSKEVKKPFTNKFFGNRYIANVDVSDDLLDLIKRYKPNISSNYTILDNQLISSYNLNNIAEIIVIKDKRYIDISSIKSFKTNAYILLVVGMAIILLFYIIFINRMNYKRVNQFNNELKDKIDEIDHQKNRIKLILDSQSSIIVITDGNEIIDANKKLIDFYKDCKDLDEFKNKYKCICKTFIDFGEDYITDKEYENNLNWAEYILVNFDKRCKVAIYDENKELRHFSIKVVESKIEQVMIVTLNDITNEINQQQNLENIVKEKTYELRVLNESLESRIEKEIKKSHEKDKIIFQQKKMTSISELLNNIAHHWRQPLSVISCIASGLKLQKEMNLLDEKEFYKSCDLIVQKTDFLSKTIDSFTSLFSKESKIETINLNRVVNDCYLHLKSIFNENNIEIKINIDEHIQLELSESDFKQSMFHLLNNSIKALNEKCVENEKVILIEYSNNKLTIQDSGFGLDENLMDKIFEPYFTTEHNYMGKGLSLFSVKEFLLKPMRYDIKAKNSKFIYNNKELKGLKFIISPLN